MSLLIRGARVVSFDPPSVAQLDLGVVGDRLVDPATLAADTPVLDARGTTVIPGLVVAHTHLYSALARGMPGPPAPTPTFRAILENVWWRLDRALDAQSLASSAAVGAVEALRAGVTTLIDHHESPSAIDGSLDVIAEQTRALGLRTVLCYGATDRHGHADAEAGLRESARFAQATRHDPLTRGIIGLHAPFTCADDTLASAAQLAAEHNTWLHLHAHEGPDDAADAEARWGTSLLHGLDARQLLSARTILAHAIRLDAAEVERARERGVWITHQARSNMNNAVGYAARLASLEKVALGTDGIDDDVLSELKAAFFRRREDAGSTAWPDPVAWLARGHTLASEVFGFAPGARLGQLVPGAPADLVVLAYDPPTPLDAGSLGAHLLFGGMSRAPVRDVVVGGRVVLQNGALANADEAALKARAREQAQALWGRMRAL